MTQEEIKQSYNLGDIVKLRPDIAQYMHLDANEQFKVTKVWCSNLENSRFNPMIGQAMYGLSWRADWSKPDETIMRDSNKFPMAIYDDHLVKVEDGDSLWVYVAQEEKNDQQKATSEQSTKDASTADAAPVQNKS